MHSSLIITSLCIAVLSMILIIVLSSVYRHNMEELKANLEEIDGELAETRDKVNELNATITQVINQSSFGDINTTLAGQEELEADLRNVDVFNSCIQEYLANCSMHTNVYQCSTGYHDVVFNGYYNLDLACHTEFSGTETISFYPTTSLRMRGRLGETIESGDSASVRLAKSEVRCECALGSLNNGAVRNEEIHCLLYRSRCPITSTFENVLIKP